MGQISAATSPQTGSVLSGIQQAATAGRLAAGVQVLGNQAAIDLLPAWARRLHGLPTPLLARPLVRAGTLGVAQTLRWAFR
jgi:hypothetical protein